MNSVIATHNKLLTVQSIDALEDWVRLDLRSVLPHAALLGTVGKLYGVGSIPTHRFGVDYPLGMIELLKNSAGALNDPLMYGWFRSQKLRYIDIEEMEEFGEQQEWRGTLLKYGVRSMMIHGVLDHSARRFAIFQLCNPSEGRSYENIALFSSLITSLAQVIWGLFLNKSVHIAGGSGFVGHPTLSLTATELHIIELLAQGLSNKEIARRRGVSDSTVKTQVQRTGAKVGATRRAEIVAMAMPMLSPLPPQSLIDYGDV